MSEEELKTHNKKLEKDNKEKAERRNKFSILYLIFIQIMGEIAVEYKERAILLYKFFKVYFVEQEKKWLTIIQNMQNKIDMYKETCKTFVNKNSAEIVSNNDGVEKILNSSHLTEENLNNHKSLIKNLLNAINEKRNKIYHLEDDLKLLQKETYFFVYEFDKIKVDYSIRVS